MFLSAPGLLLRDGAELVELPSDAEDCVELGELSSGTGGSSEPSDLLSGVERTKFSRSR